MRTLLRLGALAAVVLTIGCTRKFFRDFTDRQVEEVITEKNQYPDWKVGAFHIYPDPRARFADPANPDDPPRPPDDPAAAALSPSPQPADEAGVGFFEGTGYVKYLCDWDALNRAERDAREAEEAKNDAGGKKKDPEPAEREEETSFDRALSSDARPYLLKIEQAAELAQFNSRDFQVRREDLYVSALPVTLERFAFAAQFFALGSAIRESSGSLTPGGKTNSWIHNNEGGLTKFFPTGAALLFRLANQLVVDLGNGRREVGVSNLTLSLTQPLLQGGGYAVNLEALTQAERNLLYGIRSYARFRKLFYVAVAAGGSVFNAPFGFAGLALRGVGPNLTAPGQGYLPTLLLDAFYRNEVANVEQLESILRLYRALIEGGDISKLQAGQVEQSLLESRNSLLERRNALESALDNFKLQLGLPTNLPLELDDAPVRPIKVVLANFKQLIEGFGALRESLYAQAEVRRRDLRARLLQLVSGSALFSGTDFLKGFEESLEGLADLSEAELVRRLRAAAAARRDLLDREADLERDEEPIPAGLTARKKSLLKELELLRFELAMRAYEAGDEGADRRVRAAEFRQAVQALGLVLEEGLNELRAEARESWPEPPPVTVEGEDLLALDLDSAYTVASRVALSRRLDLMNARAQVVDAWRQIRVSANGLLGVLDVGYNLNGTTPPGLNRPFAFSGSRTTHQLSLNWELPLVRRVERNNYRIALISLQRQRRALQASEDFILQAVRSEVRELRILAENYKTQTRAVELAYSQVENSVSELLAPPEPGATRSAAGAAAALTQQLLSAQANLPRAQNALYSIWIDYLTRRLELYRDLELMPLDARGVWIDATATDRHQDPPTAGPARLPGGARPAPGATPPAGATLPTPRPAGAARP